MAKRLSGLTSKRILKALRRGGFITMRVTGSHHVLTHGERGGRVILADHGNKHVPPGTVKSILSQAGLTRDEFTDLL